MLRATATRTLWVAARRVRSPAPRLRITMSSAAASVKAPPELRFTTSPAAPVDDSTLVVLGAKQRLLDAITLLPEAARPVWSALVDAAASTSADNGGTSTTWLPPTSSGGKARKLVCVALPSVCSRHNCEAQPHAVSTLLGGMLGSTSATVLLVIPAEHALATACAVARAVPVFSLKSSSSDKASETAASEKAVITAAVVTETGAPSVTAGVLSTIQAAADGVRFASRLVDTPPEEMSTTALRQEARTVADSLKGVTYTEIVGTQLRDGGFGGLWGVGRAAVEPPALVILSYTPPAGVLDPSLPGIALVGKGIVYDTGGLSLKVGGTMPGMKCDMGGAAGVLAAFQAAVQCGVSRPLHCLLCIAENAIGQGAFRNDDVLRIFSGRTVEVNNTDAEGRLVLGDGVAYASQKLDVGIIVDMATLTGAQLVATGKRHAAIVANTDELEAAAIRAGKASGDLVHPLPFAPEFYRGEFASKVADMKNSVKDRSNAQSSCAANFVAEHLSKDWKGGWLHIDMAGPAWINERGTGYGVGLLMSFMGLPK